MPWRVLNCRIYVVNRLGVDSIQIIDPQQGLVMPPLVKCRRTPAVQRVEPKTSPL